LVLTTSASLSSWRGVWLAVSLSRLYGELRYIYKIPKEEAAERLDAWLAWASRSRLKPFVKLARTIRKHRAGVLAAIEIGISNECLSDCASW
jgi:transposase